MKRLRCGAQRKHGSSKNCLSQWSLYSPTSPSSTCQVPSRVGSCLNSLLPIRGLCLGVSPQKWRIPQLGGVLTLGSSMVERWNPACSSAPSLLLLREAALDERKGPLVPGKAAPELPRSLPEGVLHLASKPPDEIPCTPPRTPGTSYCEYLVSQSFQRTQLRQHARTPLLSLPFQSALSELPTTTQKNAC